MISIFRVVKISSFMFLKYATMSKNTVDMNTNIENGKAQLLLEGQTFLSSSVKSIDGGKHLKTLLCHLAEVYHNRCII